MSPEQLAAAKLGKAVHPKALARLFELYPGTDIRVQQHKPLIPGESYGATIIRAEVAPGVTCVGQAICTPTDQFNRKKGIKLAFDRVLDEARKLDQR